MREQTVLLRLRLTAKEVEHLDRLARKLAPRLGRSIPRAAMLRALARTSMGAEEHHAAIAEQLGTDKVRRGRSKAVSPVVGV